jgi:hypothetical protein
VAIDRASGGTLDKPEFPAQPEMRPDEKLLYPLVFYKEKHYMQQFSVTKKCTKYLTENEQLPQSGLSHPRKARFCGIAGCYMRALTNAPIFAIVCATQSKVADFALIVSSKRKF